MAIRFDAGARRAIDVAMSEVESRGHSRLGSAHLLLALLEEPHAPVAEMVRGLCGDVDRLRRAAQTALREEGSGGAGGGIEAPDATERILQQAHALTDSRGASAISPVDILLAAASSPDTVAGRLLVEAGLTLPHEATSPRLSEASPSALPRPGTGRAMEGNAPPAPCRTGIGYDSHRFAPGGPLMLGGIAIPVDYRLAGHSDGDAIAHAIIDAVLGAAAAGDIGEMFSDRDQENSGRSSIEMLRMAVARVSADGWQVQQVDVTVVAERPTVAPHRAAMRLALAQALGVAASCVSVKGKTNERMGWVGRGEGLACIAVATIVPSARA